MTMLADSIAEHHPVPTEAEKTAVQEQLERLLASSYFSHSKRFPTFLRFVVQHALNGQAEMLKERTLGIEIFGRTPDYDTAADPIVRVTAAEIRKRIAQYYQEPRGEEEIRISLPSGSYVPHFQWPNVRETEVETPPLPVEASAEADRKPFLARGWLVALVVLLAVAAAIGALFWRTEEHSPYEQFWGPLLGSKEPVLLCIADQTQYSEIALRDAADPTRQNVLKDNLSAVVMDDMNAIVNIAGLMQASGKKYSLKGEGTTDLMDLRNGPSVFVGAFDNIWTLRLTKGLRYHFGNNPEMTKLWIADSSSAQPPVWVVDRELQEKTNNYRDYGLVARFVDSTTGKLTVIAAGVSRGGTIVAGQFLTDPEYLQELAKVTPKGSGNKNVEVVLGTQIIGGQPGTPKIEAVYFW
ncbi:hypothetical protein [Acidobacterium sp. S8]|uniref:hypothetical protein n=1 Tax=Acidobacterium sp. S8 TaxID=1641854 RepID=UPI00131CD85B|nr:hypothetical protein [Acidobacterium sp. S8]